MRGRRSRPQFGVRALLWLVLLVSAACSIAVTPDGLAVPLVAFLVVALPVFLIALVAMGDNREQAFSLGAVFPAGLFLVLTVPFYTLILAGRIASLSSPEEYARIIGPICRWYAGIDLLASVAAGLIVTAVQARRERRKRAIWK